MKRLTGWDYIAGVKTGDILNGVHEQVAFDRLAQIEDIIGDTYDLDRLSELVEADKAGKVSILPVKPGDTIYQIGHKEVIPFRVGNIAVEEWGLSFEGYLEGFGVHRTMPGEKVFFTIEEANEVLERILSKEKQDGQKESSQD